MSEFVTLKAADGHSFRAYLATPTGHDHGTVVVFQEIFGVNHHIRSVTDRFAEAGYRALAPDLFARAGQNIELGYVGPDVTAGREARMRIPLDATMLDVAAAVAEARGHGDVTTVGFCWGGSLAFLSACRTPGLSAAICYYGGMIADHAAEVPSCPVMLHFGAKDAHITLASVDKVRAARPEVEIHVYEAGHGFHCDERADYHADSAKLAWGRTLDFIRAHMGGH